MINDVIKSIKLGIPVLVYEQEENEISMMVLAEKLTPNKLITMKKYASGDIGIVIDYELSKKLGVPFMHEVLENRVIFHLKHSSAAILLDHINCKTGSSDNDKMLLIRELVKCVRNKEYRRFATNTSVPGHLKFFISNRNLLSERRGHTELNITLAKLSGVQDPVLVICSLRNPKNGKMINKKDLKKFPDLKKLHIITKDEILKSWMM